MIKCIIDGKVAYPDTSNSIKATLTNQYIKDSGEYSYQISFPMAIMENRILFGNVDRFQSKKTLPEYEDCKLFVNNRLVISGKGTVQNITNELVKLQIAGGKSRVKYNSKLVSHYLDEIEFPDFGIRTTSFEFHLISANFTLDGIIETDMSNKHVVGQEGVYAFNPVYDETNGILANHPLVLSNGKSYMYNAAIQPYLLYVLSYVLQHEGFTIRRNDLDQEPWNRLVICNARKGTDIKLALPHWSVYTFIEEVRKMFNASFVFDEINKTVDIIFASELLNNNTASYECLDEFSVEYEDDGLQNLATSNIEYEFAASENRSYLDVIPKEVLRKFPVREFDTIYDIEAAAANMTQKERMTTIFKTPETYVLFILDEREREVITTAGFFNPLIRDEESDEYERLMISPVAMTKTDLWRESDNTLLKWLDVQDDNLKIVVPSMTNEKEADIENMTIDEGGDYYISVQDAIEDTDIIKEEEEDSEEKMQLMFQSECCYNYKNNTIEYPERDGVEQNSQHRYPIAFTDYRMYRNVISFRDYASLSLNEIPATKDLGELAGKCKIDRHNQTCIKFIADDIPNPAAVYLFHNKKFLAEKIELEINDKGIDRVKTGYFYEITSPGE